MDIKKLILQKLKQNKQVRAASVVKATGFSRAYINRFFQELRNEGRIIQIGKANQASYISANRGAVMRAIKSVQAARRFLKNSGLNEDLILKDIKRTTGIFSGLSGNVSAIVEYAFTEMLNNAIEHSRSKNIEVDIRKTGGAVKFSVRDKGIGIFMNIMKKRNLKNELAAIQDLLKGKQTTKPAEHSGEGIFFTSKAADVLTIQSSNKKLTFNNKINDIFIHDVKKTKGTIVRFFVRALSKRRLDAVFRKYSGNSFEFSKTRVVVKLFQLGESYVSRSQARRIISGLDKFKTVVLDFSGVKSAGQGFTDEIFRVWQESHGNIKIEHKNADENILFMIKRAKIHS